MFILFPARFWYNAALSRHLGGPTCVTKPKDMVHTAARYASHFAGLRFSYSGKQNSARQVETKYTQAVATLVVQRCSYTLIYIVSV
jgi:hypothetical protein